MDLFKDDSNGVEVVMYFCYFKCFLLIIVVKGLDEDNYFFFCSSIFNVVVEFEI